MSRVSRSTFRSAVATALALAATAALASCGGDDKAPDRAGAPTVAPTRKPQATMPAVMKSDVAVTKEGQEAISAASTKKVAESKVKADAAAVLKKIKAAGVDAERTAASAGGPTVIQADSTTVMVYPSEQLAATQAASFIRVIDTAKTDGRIARYDRVVVATSAPSGMTKKLEREFEKIGKAVKATSL